MSKINSKQKGKRGERELVKILEQRFGEGKFERTPYSGALVGGKNRNLKENFKYKDTFAGDIVCPKNFRFSIEHKFYNEISFWELFNDSFNWNEWIKQAEGDAEFVEREPLIVIKYNRHKRICLFRKGFFLSQLRKLQPEINYKEFTWSGYSIIKLEDALKLSDDFWYIK